MLIYNSVSTVNSPFDGVTSPSTYKSASKPKRSHSNRAKVVKRGGRLCDKARKIRKSKKRSTKKLSAKNLNFLKKLGLKVKIR